MILNAEETSPEIGCYLKILEGFSKNKHTAQDLPRLKSKAILKLIRSSECKNDKNFVKNALLIVLSLYDKKPMDIYNSRGKILKDCTQEQKQKILLKLQKEFP